MGPVKTPVKTPRRSKKNADDAARPNFIVHHKPSESVVGRNPQPTNGQFVNNVGNSQSFYLLSSNNGHGQGGQSAFLAQMAVPENLVPYRQGPARTAVSNGGAQHATMVQQNQSMMVTTLNSGTMMSATEQGPIEHVNGSLERLVSRKISDMDDSRRSSPNVAPFSPVNTGNIALNNLLTVPIKTTAIDANKLSQEKWKQCPNPSPVLTNPAPGQYQTASQPNGNSQLNKSYDHQGMGLRGYWPSNSNLNYMEHGSNGEGSPIPGHSRGGDPRFANSNANPGYGIDSELNARARHSTNKIASCKEKLQNLMAHPVFMELNTRVEKLTQDTYELKLRISYLRNTNRMLMHRLRQQYERNEALRSHVEFMKHPVNDGHLGIPQTLTSCVPNSQNQSPPQQQSTSGFPVGLVAPNQNGQGPMPMDMPSFNVSWALPTRESTLVKSVSSLAESCSSMSAASISSLEANSLSSSGGMPSPPATNSMNSMNPMTTIGFPTTTMIQTPVTTTQKAGAVTFQSVFQQVVQQKQQQQAQHVVETKPMVGLSKAAEKIESMKAPTPTTTLANLSMEREKPVVASEIPLDLQFPTQDSRATEAPTIPTVNNLFQSGEPQLHCVSISQIMNGIGGMNGCIPATTTSPVTATGQVQVTTAPQQQQQQQQQASQQQQSPTTVSISNDVEMGTTMSPPTQVTESSSSDVADCLGQATIETEPPSTIKGEMGITMNNNVGNATLDTHAKTATTTGPNQAGVPGMMNTRELQPHQGSIGIELGKLSDNDSDDELINFINPSCFE